MKIYKKILVIGLMILFVGTNVGASVLQNTVNNEKEKELMEVFWSDNFDSYETGSALHGQGGWEAWDDNPDTTAYVTDAQSLSSPNSVDIAWFNGFSADIVQQFEGVDSGNWRLMAWQYVPSDMVGQSDFILLNTYEHGITHDISHWSLQLAMSASTGKIWDLDNVADELPIITDEWVLLRIEIDFEVDIQEVYYDGELLLSKSWTEGTSPGGAKNLACIDLYADSAQSSSVYYDDMSLGIPESLSCDANGPYIGTIDEDIEMDGTAFGGIPPYEYLWDFGDGYTSEDPHPTHNYANAGNYTVTLTVTDSEDNTASDTTWTIINRPPNTPIIDGATSGEPDIFYTYTFTSTDPDGDDIAEYIIDWDDGDQETITGPFSSGVPQSEGHRWISSGKYIIKAKAIDIYGYESDWGELEVTMPRNKAFNTQLFRLQQINLNLIQILRILLHRLG